MYNIAGINIGLQKLLLKKHLQDCLRSVDLKHNFFFYIFRLLAYLYILIVTCYIGYSMGDMLMGLSVKIQRDVVRQMIAIAGIVGGLLNYFFARIEGLKYLALLMTLPIPRRVITTHYILIWFCNFLNLLLILFVISLLSGIEADLMNSNLILLGKFVIMLCFANLLSFILRIQANQSKVVALILFVVLISVLGLERSIAVLSSNISIVGIMSLLCPILYIMLSARIAAILRDI